MRPLRATATNDDALPRAFLAAFGPEGLEVPWYWVTGKK